LRYLNADRLRDVYLEFASKQRVVNPQPLALVFGD